MKELIIEYMVVTVYHIVKFSIILMARGFLPDLGFPRISCVVIVYSLSSIFLLIDIINCYELWAYIRHDVSSFIGSKLSPTNY